MRPLTALLLTTLIAVPASADRYGSVATTPAADAQQGFTPLSSPAAPASGVTGGSDTRFGGSNLLSQPAGQTASQPTGGSSLSPPSPSRLQSLATPTTRQPTGRQPSTAVTPLSGNAGTNSTYGNQSGSNNLSSPLSRPTTQQPSTFSGSQDRFSKDRFSNSRTSNDRFSSATQSPSRLASQGGSSFGDDRASEVMEAMLTPPSDSQLTGTPITLSEVVAGAPTRDEQSHRVEAYWDLCGSVADYYLGLREAEELRRLQRTLPAVSSALREAAKDLQVRVGTSRKAAHASQQRLASQMGRVGEVLPGDMPYCGRYNTRFNEIFAGQQAAEARELHDLLPLRHEELVGAVDAITRSEQFVKAQSQNQTSNSNGSAMIRALELLALNRRAFVQIAKDYNRRITRYSEISRPGRIDSGRLVAMLIGTPGNTTNLSFRSPNGIR